MAEGPEGFEDLSDLLGAFWGLFAEEGGKDFGVGAVGGEEFLNEGELGGEGVGPGLGFGGGGGF